MQPHNDMPAEKQHLKSTIGYIKKRLTVADETNEARRREMDKEFISAGGGYTNELQIARNLYSISKSTVVRLRHAAQSPYFTRIDFAPDNKDPQRLYIGKWGVLDETGRNPVVLDWRSPIANLYYTHQVGPAYYESGRGVVNGEILRKLLLFINEGELDSIVEADIINQDQYPNDILSDHADAKLRDVVTTIQAEQNAILRQSPARPIVVQGVAGAGKTTIALHRITWLLYTFRETMAPYNLMVVAPNPLFLDYISEVLPGLGVEDVIQETFYSLANRLCAGRLYKFDDNRSLLELIDRAVPPDRKNLVEQASRFKGSLKFKQCVERYIEHIQHEMIPGDFMMGPVRLLSESKVRSIFINDLAPFPIMHRIPELKKRLSSLVKAASEELKQKYQLETIRRANLFRASLSDDNPEKREHMQKLYSSRDRRIAQIDEAAKTAVARYLAGFPKLDLLECYKEFLSPEPPFALPEGVGRSEWLDCCTWTGELLAERRIESTDLPALIVLQKAIFGHAERLDIHHTVLDEAQDFSPFMFDILQTLTHNLSFTIVGDLSQGIYNFRGVNNWHSMISDSFGSNAGYFELSTSYRNTVEIMELAEKCAARHRDGHVTGAKPVLRHGLPPKIEKNEKGAETLAREVDAMRQAGCKTIALISKMPSDCKKIFGSLKNRIEGIKLMKAEDDKYTGGIMVLPAYLCKGLEFDGVIICDADEGMYPDDKLHCNMLYVCLTRPLHLLTVFYNESLTRLLP